LETFDSFLKEIKSVIKLYEDGEIHESVLVNCLFSRSNEATKTDWYNNHYTQVIK